MDRVFARTCMDVSELSLDEIRRCLDSGEALAVTLARQLRDLDLHLAQTTALRDRLAAVVAHPSTLSAGPFRSTSLA